MSIAWSSNSYVPMRDKTEVGKPAPVRIVSELNCEHVETACLDCLGQWMTDYTVFFSRTNGGRNLHNRMLDAIENGTFKP